LRPKSFVDSFSLLCELVFSPASPPGLSTPAPPVVCSGRLMGAPGRRWSPGGPTCRSADGDVPARARCRFGDVTAHSRLGVDVTVSGDVTKLGGAGPLAHSVYSPRGCLAGHGRRGGSAVQRRGRAAPRPYGERLPLGGADPTPPCWGRQVDGVGSSPRGAGRRSVCFSPAMATQTHQA
jgi:hypothetical protein